jgi:mono/diheme cytochrome c family protein
MTGRPAAWVALAALIAPGAARADRPRMEPPQLYAQACALCHGTDGRGAPTWEGATPVPDFTDCLTNTAEPAEHWATIIAKGGRARGLSSAMPAFEEALDPAEIRGLVAYLRTFCENWEKYPPGDLNFRRPLNTGKAYPEQELVLRPDSANFPEGSVTGFEASYENRIGTGFQYEATLPFVLGSPGETGVGDLEIEAKQVVGFSLEKLQIFSAGLGLTLPTGSRERGLGDGTTVVEPFLAFGKAWGEDGRTILQARLAGEISTNASRRDSELTLQTALSQALGPPRVSWVPAVEFLGSRNLSTGENEWSSVLEVSKALSSLGHVIASFGVRLPITKSEERYRIEAYLLWDFGDGPFWIGW